MFENSKWIWENKKPSPDEYADFTAVITDSDAMLYIAAETDYAAYVNGKIAAFGSYKGYPTVKYYDEIRLDEFLTDGENIIEIVVWYQGVDCSVSIDDGAGVIFEIVSGGKIVARSGAETMTRIDTRYKNGYRKRLTPQLGYSFLYNANEIPNAWHKAEVTERRAELLPRPVKKLVLSEPLPSKLISNSDNVYLFDLGKESAGQLYLEFYSDTEQKLTIAYGEHAENGRVARIVGNRDFSVEYISKVGENVYRNPFRRLGLRFIEIHAENPLKIKRATILSTDYPLKRRKFTADSFLHEEITRVATDTLALCMHEHFEDCVWREQALYTFDSRNEMLCSYFAFDGAEDFIRSNLILISKGVREDGYLELTYPSVKTPAIPLYSLCFIVQVYEYVKFTGDKSVLKETGKTLDLIIENFRKLANNRLIADFPYPYWNFYEWGNGSDNCGDLSRTGDEGERKRYSLILNAYYVYAEEKYSELFPEKSVPISGIKEIIAKEFFNPEKGLFRAYRGEENYTEFGNAMAVLIGLGGKDLAERLIKGEAAKVTLAAAAYLYDALLSFGDVYKDFVVGKIDCDYEKMLQSGATSFWETEEGITLGDFSCSLCHGWSALPIYYYAKTGKIRYENEEIK